MIWGKRHENFILCFCAAILVVLGSVMVYSATSVTAGSDARFGFDAAYYFKRQTFFLIVGASLAVLLTRVDYDHYRRRIHWLLAASFGLLLLVFVPGIRHSANGASRWLNLRLFTFQPSELAKFILLGYAAYAVDRKGENPKEGIRAFAGPILVMLLFAAVIYREPDFGMAAVIAVSFILVLFVAGFPWKPLVAFAAAGALAVVYLVASKPYRLARVNAFLDPFAQAQSAGYQVVQSLIAFSNGGLLGTGIGAGKQKLFYLPEIHTDYIFSVVGEELGFVGVAVVGACFLTIVGVGFRIARRSRDLFGRYLAMGLSTVIGLQAFFNMMVGLKMLPPKGMVLPFLSYGGSSLVIHMAMIGILINISMRGADAVGAEAPDRRRRHRRPRVPGDSDC